MNGGAAEGGDGERDGVVRAKDAEAGDGETEACGCLRDKGQQCPKPMSCSFAASHPQKGKTALDFAREQGIDLIRIKNGSVPRGEG